MIEDKRIKKLAANIRAERYRKGVSQDFLSKEINLTTRTISSIENGKQAPTFFAIYDIAKALGVDLKEFLKDIS